MLEKAIKIIATAFTAVRRKYKLTLDEDHGAKAATGI